MPRPSSQVTGVGRLLEPATEPDVRIKHGEQSARHTDRLPAHTQGHGAIPVHRIHNLDLHQPRRARPVTKWTGPHQVINAALITHLRSSAQPVTLNKVCQPNSATPMLTSSTLSSETNTDAAMAPSELISRS